MSNKFGSKQILPIAAFVLGAVYVGMGLLKYGFWDDINGPKSGFFPIIAGCIMMLGAILTFIQSFGEKQPNYNREDFAIVGAVLLALGASYVVGLVPAALAMVFFWLKLYEKESLKNSLIVTAVIAAIAIGVFVYWLQVPFPQGAVMELFYEQ
jgi:drug/metabolite transporter (DMT)-like permease